MEKSPGLWFVRASLRVTNHPNARRANVARTIGTAKRWHRKSRLSSRMGGLRMEKPHIKEYSKTKGISKSRNK